MSETIQLEDVRQFVRTLSPYEKVSLMEEIAATLKEEMQAQHQATDNSWSDEEIAEALKPEPRTGAEIVAAGLTGAWSDLNIEDGAAWVDRQRQNHHI